MANRFGFKPLAGSTKDTLSIFDRKARTSTASRRYTEVGSLSRGGGLPRRPANVASKERATRVEKRGDAGQEDFVPDATSLGQIMQENKPPSPGRPVRGSIAMLAKTNGRQRRATVATQRLVGRPRRVPRPSGGQDTRERSQKRQTLGGQRRGLRTRASIGSKPAAASRVRKERATAKAAKARDKKAKGSSKPKSFLSKVGNFLKRKTRRTRSTSEVEKPTTADTSRKRKASNRQDRGSRKPKVLRGPQRVPCKEQKKATKENTSLSPSPRQCRRSVGADPIMEDVIMELDSPVLPSQRTELADHTDRATLSSPQDLDESRDSTDASDVQVMLDMDASDLQEPARDADDDAKMHVDTPVEDTTPLIPSSMPPATSAVTPDPVSSPAPCDAEQEASPSKPVAVVAEESKDTDTAPQTDQAPKCNPGPQQADGSHKPLHSRTASVIGLSATMSPKTAENYRSILDATTDDAVDQAGRTSGLMPLVEHLNAQLKKQQTAFAAMERQCAEHEQTLVDKDSQIAELMLKAAQSERYQRHAADMEAARAEVEEKLKELQKEVRQLKREKKKQATETAQRVRQLEDENKQLEKRVEALKRQVEQQDERQAFQGAGLAATPVVPKTQSRTVPSAQGTPNGQLQFTANPAFMQQLVQADDPSHVQNHFAAPQPPQQAPRRMTVAPSMHPNTNTGNAFSYGSLRRCSSVNIGTTPGAPQNAVNIFAGSRRMSAVPSQQLPQQVSQPAQMAPPQQPVQHNRPAQAERKPKRTKTSVKVSRRFTMAAGHSKLLGSAPSTQLDAASGPGFWVSLKPISPVWKDEILRVFALKYKGAGTVLEVRKVYEGSEHVGYVRYSHKQDADRCVSLAPSYRSSKKITASHCLGPP